MKIKNIVAAPLSIAGASVGMGLVGDSLNSTGLKQGGEAMGKFIAPAVNISMGGYLINQLKSMQKENKKKK